MYLQFANRTLQLGGQYLSAGLRDSNDILADANALRQRMADEGYLLIRGLHDRSQVLQARHYILEELLARSIIKADAALTEAMFNTDHSPAASTSAVTNETLAQSETVTAVVKGLPVMAFFKRLLGTEVTSFNYRWLRTAGTGASSPIHCDKVFMGRGSKNLYTCWTPLCDISLNMGPLVLCLQSHQFKTIRQSYGQCDVDKDLIAGHFSEDPRELVDRFGGHWATSEFQAGDAIVFDMHMLHASLVNTSDSVRISIDTRYQPADEPVDERWTGNNPLGHYAWKKAGAKIEPLAVSRARWGI